MEADIISFDESTADGITIIEHEFASKSYQITAQVTKFSSNRREKKIVVSKIRCHSNSIC